MKLSFHQEHARSSQKTILDFLYQVCQEKILRLTTQSVKGFRRTFKEHSLDEMTIKPGLVNSYNQNLDFKSIRSELNRFVKSVTNKNSSNLSALEISNKIFINYNLILINHLILNGHILCFEEFVIYNELKKF